MDLSRDFRSLRDELRRAGEGAGREPDNPGGPLKQLTKDVLETALNAELAECLGYQHGVIPAGSNYAQRHLTKTVLTEIGPVEIEVLRDRQGAFESVIVPKRKRRLDGIGSPTVS